MKSPSHYERLYENVPSSGGFTISYKLYWPNGVDLITQYPMTFGEAHEFKSSGFKVETTLVPVDIDKFLNHKIAILAYHAEFKSDLAQHFNIANDPLFDWIYHLTRDHFRLRPNKIAKIVESLEIALNEMAVHLVVLDKNNKHDIDKFKNILLTQFPNKSEKQRFAFGIGRWEYETEPER